MINNIFEHKNLEYSIYNKTKNSYFGILAYIMLNLITNKPNRPIQPKQPKQPKKPRKRISARQVQENLDAFIQEQRKVNSILLQFIAEQREFNKNITNRIDALTEKVDVLTTRVDELTTRVDNLTIRVNSLVKNNNLRE